MGDLSLVLARLHRAITRNQPIMFDADEAFSLHDYLLDLQQQVKDAEKKHDDFLNRELANAHQNIGSILNTLLTNQHGDPIHCTICNDTGLGANDVYCDSCNKTNKR